MNRKTRNEAILLVVGVAGVVMILSGGPLGIGFGLAATMVTAGGLMKLNRG